MQLSEIQMQQMSEFVAQSFDFARNDDVQNLRIMLSHGLNANLANHKGDTLLMLAAYNNSLECARLLLEFGADVDKVNDKGHTPLAGVCFKGHYEMAKLLLEHGANPQGFQNLDSENASFSLEHGALNGADCVDSENSLSKGFGASQDLNASQDSSASQGFNASQSLNAPQDFNVSQGAQNLDSAFMQNGAIDSVSAPKCAQTRQFSESKTFLSPINTAIMFRRKEILKLLLKYSNAKLSIWQKIARALTFA